MTGVVKFFDRKRGFGYIIDDETKREFYVSRKSIIPDERATVYNTFYGDNFEKPKSLRGSTREAYLVNNESVEFQLEEDPSTRHNFFCVNITGPRRRELYFRARRRWNIPIDESYFHSKGKQRCTISLKEAQLLVRNRAEARASKNWQQADKLRNKLRSSGILVNDDTGRWKALDESMSGLCYDIETPNIDGKKLLDDFNFSSEYDVSHLPGYNSRKNSIKQYQQQKLHDTSKTMTIQSNFRGMERKGAFTLSDYRKITGSIFISNLPKHVDEAELNELMSRVGKVRSVYIKRSVSGLHKGDAVVKFFSNNEAKLAIATFGENSSFELHGRRILVREDRQKL